MWKSKLEVIYLIAILVVVMGSSSAVASTNLTGFDRMSEIEGISVCELTDIFGYVWNLEVDELGEATGTVDNAFPGGAAASGSVAAGSIDLTGTNQAPDGCSFFHDFFRVLAFCEGDTCSGIIEAHCIDEFLYSVHWEGVFTSPCVSTLIFADGFESGDVSAWSSATP
jgi:hypothetical protein